MAEFFHVGATSQIFFNFLLGHVHRPAGRRASETDQQEKPSGSQNHPERKNSDRSKSLIDPAASPVAAQASDSAFTADPSSS